MATIQKQRNQNTTMVVDWITMYTLSINIVAITSSWLTFPQPLSRKWYWNSLVHQQEVHCVALENLMPKSSDQDREGMTAGDHPTSSDLSLCERVQVSAAQKRLANPM
jgi:hypothetical protein